MLIEVISHKISGNKIFGTRLVAGEILRIGDVYDSSDGGWQKCPAPGRKVPPGEHVVWVRPLNITG